MKKSTTKRKSKRSKHILKSKRKSKRSKHILKSKRKSKRSKHILKSKRKSKRSKHILKSKRKSKRSKHIYDGVITKVEEDSDFNLSRYYPIRHTWGYANIGEEHTKYELASHDLIYPNYVQKITDPLMRNLRSLETENEMFTSDESILERADEEYYNKGDSYIKFIQKFIDENEDSKNLIFELADMTNELCNTNLKKYLRLASRLIKYFYTRNQVEFNETVADIQVFLPSLKKRKKETTKPSIKKARYDKSSDDEDEFL